MKTLDATQTETLRKYSYQVTDGIYGVAEACDMSQDWVQEIVTKLVEDVKAKTGIDLESL